MTARPTKAPRRSPANDLAKIRETAAEAMLRAEEALATGADTNAKVTAMAEQVAALTNALLVPQPGQAHSLLDRMAAVTIAAESGKAAGDRVVRVAAIVAAVFTIFASAAAALKFGHAPKG